MTSGGSCEHNRFHSASTRVGLRPLEDAAARRKPLAIRRFVSTPNRIRTGDLLRERPRRRLRAVAQ